MQAPASQFCYSAAQLQKKLAGCSGKATVCHTALEEFSKVSIQNPVLSQPNQEYGNSSHSLPFLSSPCHFPRRSGRLDPLVFLSSIFLWEQASNLSKQLLVEKFVSKLKIWLTTTLLPKFRILLPDAAVSLSLFFMLAVQSIPHALSLQIHQSQKKKNSLFLCIPTLTALFL